MKRKTAVKKVENNTVVQEKSKTCQWFDYRCILTGELRPMNNNSIERLSIEVQQWALTDPKALKISQFYHRMGIPGRTWRDWCSRFPELKEAHDAAKEIIGERREIGALNHEYNTQVVAYTMPFYDAEWKDETVRRASLKEGSAESRSSITVTMNAIPNSPLVPDKNNTD